jgi:hypothetical protein
MSGKRRPHVPPTFRGRLARLAAVAAEHAEPGGVYVQPIAHDDGCPALTTQRLADCRCEPWFRRPRRVA